MQTPSPGSQSTPPSREATTPRRPASQPLSRRGRLLEKIFGWGHRYQAYRAGTLALTLVVLFAVPLLGLARFDLWGGDHWMLGHRANALEGLIAIIVGIIAFYFVTFVLNAIVGRLFCGWGCPVAQVARFGEEVEIARKRQKGGAQALAKAISFGAALSASVMLWWVSPRVLLEGSALELASTVAVFVGLVAATYLHGRYLRWAFCKKACPIGLYYSFVAPDKIYGIVFDDTARTCKDCKACELVCPVDLDPRHLADPKVGIGGLAVDGLPSENHCLRCGDCVSACEYIFREERGSRIPLLFGLTARAQSPAGGEGPPPAEE